jgi:hypothetical protein
VEIAAARDEHVLDDVRVIDQDRATEAQTDGDDIAELARARRVEAQLIALEVGQAPEREAPLRARGTPPAGHHVCAGRHHRS